MTVDQFVKIISWALPLAAIAGAMFVYLRQSADKATIETLEKRVEVTKGLLEDQQAQHDNDRAEWERKYESDLRLRDAKIKTLGDELSHVKQQNTTLARQVHTLQGVVTQAAEIARLQETLDIHHGEATEHWRALLDAVEGVREAMS